MRPLEGDDSLPLRHEVLDVPPLQPVVTEYRRNLLCCSRWGVTTCGLIFGHSTAKSNSRILFATPSRYSLVTLDP
jgi:hypothetical protein